MNCLEFIPKFKMCSACFFFYLISSNANYQIICADTWWNACILQSRCCWKAWNIDCCFTNCTESGWCISGKSLAAEHCKNQIIFQSYRGKLNPFWGFLQLFKTYIVIVTSIVWCTFYIARSCFYFLSSWLFLQHKKPADGMIIGNSSRSIVADGTASPKYSDRLSPAINNYLSEASRQEVRLKTFWML